MTKNIGASPLGKNNIYKDIYDKSLLFAIERKEKRDELGINPLKLPFYGYDLFNAYEISWLNTNNKPLAKMAQIVYNANSKYLVESKSLKLYFNSFNNTNFTSKTEVIDIIKNDLQEILSTDVDVKLFTLNKEESLKVPYGKCIDDLDISTHKHTFVNKDILKLNEKNNPYFTEALYSNILKSNCLVTGQPDWGSIEINYIGNPINHSSLLEYIISYRNHNEFHEQCIERIFIDILDILRPTSLTILGRYTRRGGIDINPFRSTEKNFRIFNSRLIRQ